MKVLSVNTGKPQTIVYKGKELVTGIYKFPATSAVYLTSVNLDGDGQADLEFHGGADKALCVYCGEHYAYWADELGVQLNYGAFGENVTVSGMLESMVCVGDTYELGEAIIQISEPRRPCHKLAKRHDHAELPLKVQRTGYTGYYCRVLREGWIPVNPGIRLIDRHPEAVTVEDVNKAKYSVEKSKEAIERILAVKELSESWRASLSKLVAEQGG